ncbi:MAG: hypothetical protein ACC628_12780 [Pirellulaceae bacterium]
MNEPRFEIGDTVTVCCDDDCYTPSTHRWLRGRCPPAGTRRTCGYLLDIEGREGGAEAVESDIVPVQSEVTV